MKPYAFLACATALVALAGCNKNDQSNVTSSEPVKLQQVAPPPGGDWTQVVNATSAGYMMGNPNAKVKLVEIGALTCPHCREFEEKGAPVLVDKYVKSGQVSWEFRPYLLHGLDLPAVLIAGCNGAQSFFPLMKALYDDQEKWIAKVQGAPEAEAERVQNLPINQQFVALARMAGLQDWAAARGVAQAKSTQCLSNEKEINRLVQVSSDVTNQFPSFEGTPSFIINGTMLDKTATWEKLQPQLDAALK
ncbi:thioredoxin domain-containing protein [Sphingomonas segetis]|jgi:protein-disulfide isomerase|uniref:thioredoxin domain-containing protein n=1 Tax=Sphingomonas segetis TaxID=1104779 RepID=UPI0018AD4629|nr:thioredoxin domain-containing protein [Sphingomonas segetis]